jgi:hypothetical protein
MDQASGTHHVRTRAGAYPAAAVLHCLHGRPPLSRAQGFPKKHAFSRN